MKHIFLLATAALLAAPLIAAPCKDAKGRFTKCPTGATPTGTAAVSGNITKDKNGKCHIIKPAPGQKAGQFAPCPK